MQLADSLGDSAFVHVLTKAEQRVDAAIASKHAHIHEAMRHPARTPKRLRLYLSNTHANQSQDASLGDPATGGSACCTCRMGMLHGCSSWQIHHAAQHRRWT